MKTSKLTKAALWLFFFSYSLLAHADFIGQNVAASNVFYVSTSAKGGNDSNPCTASKPCLTLAGAAAKVTKAGSIIHVNTKQGVFIETAQTILAVGVSIECDGSSYNGIKAGSALQPMIEASSTTEGVDGNQSITNCNLDGNSLTGMSAFRTKGRSNVRILYNNIHDWLDRGVDFHGISSTNITNNAPTIFARGNEFGYNTVTNSSRFSGYGRGELQIGGQDGMYIHDNNMNQSGRGANGNGWTIKYLNDGFNKNTKIVRNTLYRESFVGDSFNFVMELWHELGGTEIAYNNLYPMTDVVGAIRGTAPYGLWFHDNLVGDTSMVGDGTTPTQRAIVGLGLEGDMEYITVENNTFRNLSYMMIDLELVNNVTKHDIVIKNNLGYNVWGGLAGNLGTNTYIYNLSILNNTLYTTLPSALDGLNIFTGVKNALVANNIIVGFTRSPIMIYGGSNGTINELAVNNNVFFNNGHSNTTWFNGTTGYNYQELNTVTSNPNFTNTATFDFSLQAGSPAIGIGVDVGVYEDILHRNRLQKVDAGAYQYNRW